jgi:CDP-diacylglycerol--glycerol-3-phosphate 3-phosphatidyltransferase
MTGQADKQAGGNIFNIPNSLSFLRIIIAPFIFYYMGKEDSTGILALLILIAFVSDYLDGITARKLNMITDAGKIIDPLADKVIVIVVMVGVVVFRDFPLWALIIILARDLVILIVGLLIVKKTKIVPVSNNIGKGAVNAYAVTFIAYIFNWEPVKLYLLALSLVMVVVSSVSYYKSNYQMLKDAKMKNY